MKKNKKVVMLILDGWGLGKKDKFNAIDNAKTPNVDKLIRKFPNIQLRADGRFVGLPDGQFGTSEINHMVIGSGRAVMQDLPKIDNAIKDGTFFTNAALINACKHVLKFNSKLHIVGIASEGKVHASLNHALQVMKLASEQGVQQVYFHPFTDGRDTPPKSIDRELKVIESEFKKYAFKNSGVATIQGRFFLDRDREWSKTEKAVNLLVKGEGRSVTDYQAAINFSYNKNVSDEFFEQFILNKNGIIENNDAVIFYHYRSDRMYQLQKALLDHNIENLKVVSFINVFDTNKTDVAFPRQEITHTLARAISEAKKNQLHITETEKYTHLTFFLNAGRDKEYPGEVWERIQSNRFVKPFYNFDPLMKADGIAKRVIEEIEKDSFDFMVANFSNTDMVGHTGNYEAAVVAAEAVDYTVGKIYEVMEDKLDDYALIVTADHGNSDEMWDYEANQPHTQHTLNPVPFILVSDIKCKLDRKESLEDIAPTILDLMGIEKPETMTGNTLIIENDN